jgi:uncharacterized protein YbjT (DUF2867 family)
VHVSGRRIARELRADGHDVLALNEGAELAALSDPDVLGLAAREGRILVTFNARHFVPLVRVWAEGRREHAGCVIVYGIDHGEFGLILDKLRALFSRRRRQEDWMGLTDVLTRST